MAVSYTPDRADLIWLDFNPTRGHEQAGHRPALVISPAAYNGATGLCVVAAITSRAKGLPFEISVNVRGESDVILADQLRTVAWAERRAEFIAEVPAQVLEAVDDKLRLLLQL